MTLQKTSGKIISYYLLSFFLLWIILFEFILPVNNFLPKPSIVLDSFGALWKDYHLLVNFISSIAAVYISVIASYYLLRLLNKNLLNEKKIFHDFIFSMEWFLKYIPGIVPGFLLIYWFPGSLYTKYFFIFTAAFNSLLIKHTYLTSKINQIYVDSAASLGANESIIANKVIWKSFEPDLINHIYQSNLYYWTILIIFEFANFEKGVGFIFRRALEFKDLSALFAVIIITGIIIYLGSISIKFFKHKFAFWHGVED
jgi:taurine transport system permease protein